MAAARKVEALGDGSHGFAIRGKEIETDAYRYYALWTHGGELIKGGESGIDAPAGVRAATLCKRLIDEGMTQPDPTAYNRQVGVVVSIPFTVTVLLGGLSDLPEDIYGAARIDGTGGWPRRSWTAPRRSRASASSSCRWPPRRSASPPSSCSDF